MELYNFFTKQVTEPEEIEELKTIFEELKPICEFVELVKFNDEYSIIGQMYGEDTNVGDTELLAIMWPIKFTWFDAICPKINNIKDPL